LEHELQTYKVRQPPQIMAQGRHSCIRWCFIVLKLVYHFSAGQTMQRKVRRPGTIFFQIAPKSIHRKPMQPSFAHTSQERGFVVCCRRHSFLMEGAS
jgi:hypothetical protein